jgi:Gram-negative bacterial TonB protein C-terminal
MCGGRNKDMCSRALGLFVLLSISGWALAQSHDGPRPTPPPEGGDFSNELHPDVVVPKDVILVKGAWSSASDQTTPLPENSAVTEGVFSDNYFGMQYALPKHWVESFKGPPPSTSGLYVLGQLKTGADYKGPARASMLITAQDLFFSPLPVTDSRQLVNYTKEHLQADYKVELPLTLTKLGGHSFSFFAYWSPAAQLHWYFLATEIRCHTVQIVITSRDTKLLADLVLDVDKIKLPEESTLTPGAGGGAYPVCTKDYAKGPNVLNRVEPLFTESRYNTVPVRIVIDSEGKVKHIHFLSAFPDQAQAITEALEQWRFRPYLQDGKPVEVETGLVFGRAANASPTRSLRRSVATQ